MNDVRLTFRAPFGRDLIRYVPNRHGWHVYITEFDPFPLVWAATLGEAIAAGRKIALRLGYTSITEKLVDYK